MTQGDHLIGKEIAILDDVIAELFGEESHRPEGIGITSDLYLQEQLMKLRELIVFGGFVTLNDNLFDMSHLLNQLQNKKKEEKK